MGTAERRKEIMKLLCRRRYETVCALASEFGVSERTIRRDVEALSLSEPIYTKSGRYDGGIYVMEGYSPGQLYLSDAESAVLQKLYSAMKGQQNQVSESDIRKTDIPFVKISPANTLTKAEFEVFGRIVKTYRKPDYERRQNQ